MKNQRKSDSWVARSQVAISAAVIITYFVAMFTGEVVDISARDIAEAIVVLGASLWSIFTAYNNPDRSDTF